jgi:hypothetical protein
MNQSLRSYLLGALERTPTLSRYLHRFLKWSFYGNWPECPCLEDGYTIFLVIPADMPFLLRFALEGIRHLQLPNCKQILVISDGSASDRTLRNIVAEHGDQRLRYVPLKPIDKILLNIPRSDGSGNFRHFTSILRGILATTTEAIYLHDADAFWLEEGGVESQYREFREREMYTLGVTARKEFREQGLAIAATWELILSNSWVRTRLPAEMKSGWYPLPNGQWKWFDTLLYDEYMDYSSGRIGVMLNPPKLLHFYGTVIQYRRWQRNGRSKPTEDKTFVLLLLSILAEAIPEGRQDSLLPHPHQLACGLSDASAPITYLDQAAPTKYAEFRNNIDVLCSGPAFSNDVTRRIYDLLAPFDEHFRKLNDGARFSCTADTGQG